VAAGTSWSVRGDHYHFAYRFHRSLQVKQALSVNSIIVAQQNQRSLPCHHHTAFQRFTENILPPNKFGAQKKFVINHWLKPVA